MLEYLKDLNATQAAIRAGYSSNRADVIGYENLRKPVIAAAITAAMKERAATVRLEGNDVLFQIKAILTSDIRHYLSYGPNGVTLKNSSMLTDEHAACISEVTETVSQTGSSVKFKLHDKAKAIDMAARHLGLYAAEKREISFSEETDNAIREAIHDLVRGVK